VAFLFRTDRGLAFVDRPGAGFIEEIIFDLGRPNLRVAAQFFAAHQAAILGLDANDAIHRLTI